MLFYEFFRSKIGEKIKVIFKSGVHLSGSLISIDPYLNLRIDNVEILSDHPGLKKISLCSVRGSTIKYIFVEENKKEVELLNAGCRIRAVLNK